MLLGSLNIFPKVKEGNPDNIPFEDSGAHYGCMSIDDIYKLPVQDISR